MLFPRNDADHPLARSFKRFLQDPEFPCVGAKSALSRNQMSHFLDFHPTVLHDDAPDERTGTDQRLSLIGQMECAPHHFRVKLSRSCANQT